LGVDNKSADDDKKKAKRKALPAHLPRREVKPRTPIPQLVAAAARCSALVEDVSEKLDYQPGVFTVERHVRGKWTCRHCERLIQAPVPAHVIDKGIPTAGLLAHVLVAKFMDHLAPVSARTHL
jgi:transposase